MNKQLLIGCGILRKEITWLINKNRWPLDTVFLDSSLHIDFEKLDKGLTSKLKKHSNRDVIVFYGECHPLMDNIIEDFNVMRSKGQNCVDMLLGNEVFTRELSNGAYFLLEDWALRWDSICSKTFGENHEVTRQIFQDDRKYMLGLKTPCSGNFTTEAEIAAQQIGLPFRWMEVGLDNLEATLFLLLEQKGSKKNG